MRHTDSSNSCSEHAVTPDGAKVEIGISSDGIIERMRSLVRSAYVVGYVGRALDDGSVISMPRRRLDTWEGQQIGTVRITATWLTPRSAVSSTMSQAYAWVNGVRYTGRTAGEGMIFKGRRCAKQ